MIGLFLSVVMLTKVHVIKYECPTCHASPEFIEKTPKKHECVGTAEKPHKAKQMRRISERDEEKGKR
jgi:hypothetical protein